jgi:hypothetical protein
MTAQKRIKVQVLVLILVVFVLGGATGASIDALYRQRQQTVRMASTNSLMVERMRQELDLSDRQVEQLRVVIQGMRKETAVSPGIKEIRDRTDVKIRALLTAEQWDRYLEMKARRDPEKAADPENVK